MKKTEKKNGQCPGKEKNPLAVEIGKRIRAYRNAKGYTQEILAERAECHTTYIGQLERGEKNATIESISKIAAALEVSLSLLFEMSEEEAGKDNFPLLCYRMISEKPKEEQARLYAVLRAVEDYRNL